ncbi:hypothetical protein [Methanonatronarchaeum sp. AMET-Sl]|uniref:hypothetical protein n=1 Tax=Methanonatronarchaeum sp. AMET-Sl TaxID=3037654 RepID=UPI00244E5929|nr:hypothetical protein [Methanonatronarchaeum sp. AMET-Sl]WGI17663.1 hypothetical protein QEN48_01245 [Methanonatronarchaeum sp. AMET-Sl]
MILSIITTTTTSSTAIAAGMGVLVAAFLIALVSSKEVLSATSIETNDVKNMMNSTLIPLVFAFFAVVLYQAISFL